MSEPFRHPREDSSLDVDDIYGFLQTHEDGRAPRLASPITSNLPFTHRDEAAAIIPTHLQNSSNAYAAGTQASRRSSGSSRQSAYYDSTGASSVWDASSSRYSASTVNEPSTDILPALYPCELEGMGCDWWYILSYENEWIEHIAVEHLHEIYPETSVCWYCDDYVFRARDRSQEAKRAAFTRRMHHIVQHIRSGDMGRRRPDYHLVRHLVKHGLVEPWVEEAAATYHEAPQPRDMEFVPESQHARGHKGSGVRAAGYRYQQQPAPVVACRPGRRGRRERTQAYVD